MREYYEVLNRRKFSRYPDFVIKADALLVDIERKATLFRPSVTLNIINDFSDNRLLELAKESNADFLVTGNNDFTVPNHKQTIIISPKEYYQNHSPYQKKF